MIINECISPIETEIVTIAKENFVVTTKEDLTAASERLQVIKQLKKQVEDFCDPVVKKTHQAWKEACAQKKTYIDPLDAAERKIKGAIGLYMQKEEMRLREERIKKEAELRRIQEEQALKLAAECSSQEEVEQILEEAIADVPIVPMEKPEGSEGVSIRKSWDWTLLNLSLVKPEFLVTNDKSINSIVKSTGKNAEQIVGGIKVFEKTTVVSKKI